MLKLIVLNGKLQGSEFNLFEGMTIGSSEGSDVVVKTAATVEVICDAQGNFSLQCQSKQHSIDLAGERLSKLEAAPGMIFSIDSIGFSVQEEGAKSQPTKLQKIELTELFNANERNTSALYPIYKPLH